MIGFAETAVNDNELAAAFDGAFALPGLDGDVSVDDVAMGAFQTKFFQNEVANLWILIAPV